MSPKDTVSKSPSNTNPSKTAAEPKAAPEVKPTPEPAATEPQAAPAASDGGKSSDKTIISLSVDNLTARRLRLLAKVTGVTISKLVLDSFEKELPGRLKTALASIAEDE